MTREEQSAVSVLAVLALGVLAFCALAFVAVLVGMLQ